MSKRFTDSEIWEDPWFRRLPCEYKELWRYMYERCNHAGIWKKDFDMASYYIGKKVDEQKALKLFNDKKERIWILNEDKWFIPQYITFQYKVLREGNKPHDSVIEILLKNGLWQGVGLPLKKPNADFPCALPELPREPREKKARFLDFVNLTSEEYEKLRDKLGSKNVELLIEKLNNYIGSHGKKYKSHYHTILNWAIRENVKKPFTEPMSTEKKPEYSEEDKKKVHELVQDTIKKMK